MNSHLISGKESDLGWSDFQSLNCWKAARIVRQNVAILVKGFPDFEKIRLKDQLIRASRSATANIAEGYGRYHFKDQIKFCVIARGSMVELYDHLITAKDENYISSEQLEHFYLDLNKSIILLNGYIKYLRSRHKQETSNRLNQTS